MARRTRLDASYIVTIKNFDKFNEKSKGKPIEWFRMDSRLVGSSKYKALSSTAKHLWIWLLCECAMSSKREAIVHPKDTARDVHGKQKGLERGLKELLSLEWIQILRTPYNTDNTDNTIHIAPTSKPAVPEQPIDQAEIIAQPTKFPHRVSKAVTRGCHADFSDDEICKTRLSNVTLVTQNAWLEVYDQDRDWICREIKSAHAWCVANPRKAPKDFGKFMTNWLLRSHEKMRKTVKSNNRQEGWAEDVL